MPDVPPHKFKFEEGAFAPVGREPAIVSAAISLKRIANTLEEILIHLQARTRNGQ